MVLINQRITLELPPDESREVLGLLRDLKEFAEWYKKKNLSVCATDEDDETNIHGAHEITGRSVATLYGDVHAKTIPHYRRGRLLRFSKKQLLAWKTEGKTTEQIDEAASNYIVNYKK